MPSDTVKYPTAWSYSRWKLWATCALQYFFRFIEKRPEKQSDAKEDGDAAHTMIAAYIRGDLPREDPIVGWTYWERVYKILRDNNPLVEQEWGFTDEWRKTGWLAHNTWFRSKQDVVDLFDDGEAHVFDWKTGKPRPDDCADQAEVYAISVYYRYPDIHRVVVRFCFVDLAQEGKELVYRFSADMIEQLIPKWEKRASRLLKDRIFPPKPGKPQCDWCSFAKSKGGPCRYG